jgi:cytosine deaminase
MDIILKNALVAHEDQPVRSADIAIEGERIAAVEPNITADAGQVIDCGGRLVSGSLIDPHVHLDATLTAGLEANVSGTLHEGIAIWGRQKKIRTVEAIKERAKQAIDWEVAQGSGFIRTHADTSDENQLSMQALLEVKDEVKDRVDLQIVAFPQDGIHSHPGGPELFLRALDMGPDVVGGIPHNEATREAGLASLKLSFDEAEKRDLLIDTHCDEIDDPNSRYTEVMAHETYYRGMQGRVTASHCAAMHSYSNAYAFRLFGWLQQGGLNIIANPFDNLILLAREDTYPKRRSMTRVKELWQAGINVGIGHDSIMDPWYPLGRGDMVDAASLALHVCQMSGTAEVDACFDMITWRNSRNLALDGYGVAPGCQADLVVFDASSKADVIRINPACTHVFKRGKLVAETAPAASTVMGEAVDFVLRS